MNPSLWFVVPAHGRLELAAICLRQLRRTCDRLEAEGVNATAVVVADDENLDTARELGFGTVPRNNAFVSRKFNDGIQYALDQTQGNPHPADYVVPCGSDDWVDHRLFLELPPPDTMVGFRAASFVSEDGKSISTTNLNNPGGAGVRIFPRGLLAPLGYRPADEDRGRGCDTSILVNLQRHHGDSMRIASRHLHDRQIVDWKTEGHQLNTYDDIRRRWRFKASSDPFEELAGIYPAAALNAMALHYGRSLQVAA